MEKAIKYILKVQTYTTYIQTYIDTYIDTCIHTYIHTHKHTYIHTYIHTNIHAYIHTYIHTHKHTCIHTHIHNGPSRNVHFIENKSTFSFTKDNSSYKTTINIYLNNKIMDEIIEIN